MVCWDLGRWLEENEMWEVDEVYKEACAVAGTGKERRGGRCWMRLSDEFAGKMWKHDGYGAPVCGGIFKRWLLQ